MLKSDRLLSSHGRPPGSDPALELRIPSGSREAHQATWNRDVPRVVATLVVARELLGQPFVTKAMLDLLKRLSLRAVVPMAKRASLVGSGFVTPLGTVGDVGLWDVTDFARTETERLAVRSLLDEPALRGVLRL